MKRFMLICVFGLTLASVAIMRVPLGFVLDRSALKAAGVSWSAAHGTLWSGEIRGLRYGAQTVGLATLTFQPHALLNFELGYEVTVRGPAGQGIGMVSLTPGGDLTARDMRGQVLVSELVGLNANIRQIGGTARFNIPHLQFSGARCQSASGTLSTDVLSRAAVTYGRTFGQFDGDLSCDGDALSLAMAQNSDAGDMIEVTVRIGGGRPPSVAARVETRDVELQLALSNLGFSPSGGAYVYRRGGGQAGGQLP